MPRGDKAGSVKHVAANKQTGEPEQWIVRRRYTVKGKQKEKKRSAYSLTQATRTMRAINLEVERELAGEPVADSRHTFDDLLRLAKQREMKPAEYCGETKVAGMRSWTKTEANLKPLEAWFGKMILAEISYDDLDGYKRARLRLPTIHGGRRSIASVNRELSLARRLFSIAERERWISRHPFHLGPPLIQAADEVSRMRILSFAEEERLLDQCVGRRRHLRLHIVFAIETAMRRNEQLTLRLSDIDFADRVITLRAFNSKTAKVRVIPVFDRLARELEASLIARRNAKPDDLLFIDGCPRRAFEGACVDAGIDGLRWHDLRHTAITRRLHTYGLQPAEVMKISGHDILKTFLRYVNIDREIATSIRQRVDAARAAAAEAARISPSEIPTAAEAIDLGDVTEVPQ